MPELTLEAITYADKLATFSEVLAGAGGKAIELKPGEDVNEAISRVWGRHSPTRFPQGQNERKANFGTSVESCSKKLPDCRSLATATFSGNL